MKNKNGKGKPSFTERAFRKIFGAPRNLQDPSIFHKLALIPFFAWIGLGADGLSSSAYGPEEAFRTLGTHTYLALFLALGTSLTVFIISYAYSRIIEHFPYGGGGYIVATHMLGKKAGVISGCALIVDYMLTITVSVVSCTDALFSYLPLNCQHYKLFMACILIVFLVIMNIRGIKESVLALAPIFIVFIITHVLMIGYGIFSHLNEIGPVIGNLHESYNHDLSTIGIAAIFMLFFKAYSLGGGTYTGIEAVSNGLQIMRNPKVRTGKITMAYMASSLAITASGLLLCYLLMAIRPIEGKTLNAVLASFTFSELHIGHWLPFITILSEGALLLVAAQAGFIDGPRVMANMAVDSWFPHLFASLSDRLTMRNGVMVMGAAALVLTIYTHGSISILVIMYSINVFLTFSISEYGMSRFFIKNRKKEKHWKKHLSVHMTGLILCLTILMIMTYEKFFLGGWITFVITSFFIMMCYLIQNHYSKIRVGVQKLDKYVKQIPASRTFNNKHARKNDMTAIQLVSDYNSFGVHILLAIDKSFPGLFANFIFVSVGVVDQGMFKGEEGIENLHGSVEESMKKYVQLARKLGYAADYRITIGTDVVESATDVCLDVVNEFKHSTVFSGQITFGIEKFYHKLLHNETAYAIQRRLQSAGINNVIMPINIDFK